MRAEKLLAEGEAEKQKTGGEEAPKKNGAVSMEFFVKALLKQENAKREDGVDCGDQAQRQAGAAGQTESRNGECQ